MLTVRFPNGIAVSYNQACECQVRDRFIELVDKQGYWYAKIPTGTGCVVESVRPCRVTNKLDTAPEVLNYVLDNLRDKMSQNGGCEKLAALKAALRKFDARTFAWR